MGSNAAPYRRPVADVTITDAVCGAHNQVRLQARGANQRLLRRPPSRTARTKQTPMSTLVAFRHGIPLLSEICTRCCSSQLTPDLIGQLSDAAGKHYPGADRRQPPSVRAAGAGGFLFWVRRDNFVPAADRKARPRNRQLTSAEHTGPPRFELSASAGAEVVVGGLVPTHARTGTLDAGLRGAVGTGEGDQWRLRDLKLALQLNAMFIQTQAQLQDAIEQLEQENFRQFPSGATSFMLFGWCCAHVQSSLLCG